MIKKYSGHLDKGEILVQEGEKNSYAFFIIKSGKAGVSSAAKGLIRTVFPGTPTGEFSFLCDQERSASIIGLEECTYEVIYREEYNSQINKLPAELKTLIEILVNKITGKDTITPVKIINMGDMFGDFSCFNDQSGYIIIDEGSQFYTIVKHEDTKIPINEIGNQLELKFVNSLINELFKQKKVGKVNFADIKLIEPSDLIKDFSFSKNSPFFLVAIKKSQPIVIYRQSHKIPIDLSQPWWMKLLFESLVNKIREINNKM